MPLAGSGVPLPVTNIVAHFGHFTFLPGGTGLLGRRLILHPGQLSVVSGMGSSH
jgi:hypothetical protein